jgi:pyruvate dehydrogenase E1 component alpha subunit
MPAEEMDYLIQELVEKIRQGDGPALLEAKTYRWHGHFVGEEALIGERKYRSEEEIEEWKKRDPVVLFRNHLSSKRLISEHQLQTIEADTGQTVKEAVEYAQRSPMPESEEAI